MSGKGALVGHSGVRLQPPPPLLLSFCTYEGIIDGIHEAFVWGERENSEEFGIQLCLPLYGLRCAGPGGCG